MADRSAVVQGFTIRLNRRTGRYDVPIPVPGGRRKTWISTGATSLEDAKRVVEESGVERLVLLARANALSSDAVSLVLSGRRVTCAEILEAWERDNAGRWSDATLRHYRTSLLAFFQSAKCTGRTLTSVTKDSLSRFVNRKELKQVTRRGVLAAIRSFYGYAKAKNYIVEDLAQIVYIRVREMQLDQLERREVFPLTEAEYRLILGDPRTSGFWRAVTSIAYWTGLRFNDCASLEWSSVTKDSLVVWTKKRGMRVALPLDEPLLGAGELRTILEAIPRTDPVFCFPHEHAVSMTSKRNKFPMAFRRILLRLGISFKSFHSTRHAAASRFARAGKSLEEIGRILAHSDTETTKNYVHAEG